MAASTNMLDFTIRKASNGTDYTKESGDLCVEDSTKSNDPSSATEKTNSAKNSATPQTTKVAKPRKVTTLSIASKKRRGQKITMVTAYDYPSAVHVDRAGIDVVLVGDSCAMVELGFDTTQVCNSQLTGFKRLLCDVNPNQHAFEFIILGLFCINTRSNLLVNCFCNICMGHVRQQKYAFA